MSGSGLDTADLLSRTISGSSLFQPQLKRVDLKAAVGVQSLRIFDVGP